VGTRIRPRPAAVLLAVVFAALTMLAQACSQSLPPPGSHVSGTGATAPGAMAREVARPVGPHGGVNLNVLLVTDGTPPVEAIRSELTADGMPVTAINLHSSSRRHITSGFLARTLPDGTEGGNFDGIVLPAATVPGLSGHEMSALASYERKFSVRQVDAYTPPDASTGMSNPSYSGPLSGTASVTSAGDAAGFGYLNQSFPFSGAAAGAAPYGYLAQPESSDATPLVTAAIPRSSGSGALVWQYTDSGREQLGVGFAYADYTAQFHYLAHGIVSWLTRGVNLTNWRAYLDIAFDDMFLGDAQWSTTGHCTPGDTPPCPPGTPMTATIRMVPADVTYAVQWEKQHDFKIEFLYNGGASSRFLVNGEDSLLVATRPVAGDFYWVNHTWSHAYFGCKQDFTVSPWQCVKSNGQIVWAASASLINSQIMQNFAWAKQEGIPAEPGVVASGEYSGLLLLPQQPVDNPNLDNAMGRDGIKWIALDASREPDMRPVGAALGVPRHPIDIGYDVDTIASEVNEFNWNNDSKADGGSGLCQGSKVTACLIPMKSATAEWNSVIVPGQAQIVYGALLDGDPRPFFMHQSNLAGDRIAYPVMDDVLSAYRAVFNSSTPIENLPMSGDGTVLRNSQLWEQALKAGTVTAWVQGHTVTISGPPGTPVPVTVPDGTGTGSAGGPEFGTSYAGGRAGWATLGSQPLKLTLGSAPYQS
jgi:hypothetical protein